MSSLPSVVGGLCGFRFDVQWESSFSSNAELWSQRGISLEVCVMLICEGLFIRTGPGMHRLCRGSRRDLWTVSKLLPCWLTNRTCSFLRSVGTELEMPLALSYFWKRTSETEIGISEYNSLKEPETSGCASYSGPVIEATWHCPDSLFIQHTFTLTQENKPWLIFFWAAKSDTCS